MFEWDLEESTQYPRNADNPYILNSSLEPWSRQEAPRKQPLMKYKKTPIKPPTSRRAGTEEQFRKRTKKKEETTQLKQNIPISTLDFYPTQNNKKEVKKFIPIIRFRKTAKSQGKFLSNYIPPNIQKPQLKQSGWNSSLDKMNQIRKRMQHHKKYQHLFQRGQSFTVQPALSQVLLETHNAQNEQINPGAQWKESKKPKKNIFVGLHKFKGKKRSQPDFESHLRGHSMAM